MDRNHALTEKFLNGKHVLFRGDKSHGYADMIGGTYDGSVVAVYPETNEVMVCFLYGHRSCTDAVSFDNLLAIFDKENGTNMKIDRFSGPMIDLRNAA